MKDKKLHTIKNTGFKIPNDYFETLDDTIVSKLTESRLSYNFNTNGFKVPDNYFETFDDKILDTIGKKETGKVRSLLRWKNVAYLSGMAASLVLAFNLVFNDAKTLTFEDLETASIESYLLNEDLSAYDIAPYLNTAELDSDYFIDNHMNASDIEAYLIQNSDVMQLITEQ